MRFLMVFCLLLASPRPLPRTPRDVKTANPFILCTSRSRRLQRRITLLWRKTFSTERSAKYAQLAAISASVAMKCVYCIPAHTAFARGRCHRRGD